MSDQPNATTIELDYAGYPSVREHSPTTTIPVAYHFEFGQEVRNRQADQPTRASSASVLKAYLEQVITGPSPAIIEGGFLFIPATESPVLGARFEVANLQQHQTFRSRRERYAMLITLIESWLADDSGYDEEVWPQLKAGIEESRTSTRKRFNE